MFKPLIHDLVWPISASTGGHIKRVKISTLTVDQFRSISKPYDKDEGGAPSREFIGPSTGLSKIEIEQLKTPDYLSIQRSVLQLVESSSVTLQKDLSNSDNPSLLIPICGDDGQDKTVYQLQVPTVGTTDKMEAHEDTWTRSLFLSVACTGFSPSEIGRMSLPDWNYLQERLKDFLEKPADYFRQ